MRVEILLQQIINGLVQGSVYALVALGYTMVYGILGLINFAHGEMVMVGAMVALATMQALLAAAVDVIHTPAAEGRMRIRAADILTPVPAALALGVIAGRDRDPHAINVSGRHGVVRPSVRGVNPRVRHDEQESQFITESIERLLPVRIAIQVHLGLE